MKLLLVFFVAASLAQAGIVKVVTFPFRHPVKTFRSAGHTVFYPVIHPKKTAKAVWFVVY